MANALTQATLWHLTTYTLLIDMMLGLRRDLMQTREDVRQQGVRAQGIANEQVLQQAVLAQQLRGQGGAP